MNAKNNNNIVDYNIFFIFLICFLINLKLEFFRKEGVKSGLYFFTFTLIN